MNFSKSGENRKFNRWKVGNGGVGKSSMIQRFATGIFTQEYKKTIGVDFLEKSITMGGLELRRVSF